MFDFLQENNGMLQSEKLTVKGKNVLEKVKTVSKKCELSAKDDSDFKRYPISSKKPKLEAKVMKKEKKFVMLKEFPSMKNKCSLGSFLGVIWGLSREQK